MANNLIQIKRSLNTATPGSLANGEFAYTANGDVLYIGSNSSVVAIGGARNPGTLTANQALVANSTSGIDKIIVANAVLSYVTANGNLGISGQLLASNSTGGVYWMSAGSVGTNTDAQYVWSNTHTFQNTITFSQTINGTANNALYLGGTAASGYQTTAGLSANVATLTSNNSAYLGGTVASGYQTTAGLSANVATLTANNSSYLGGYAAAAYAKLASPTFTGVVNAADVIIAGNTQLGDSSSDVVSFVASVNTDIIPSANNTYSLGSSTMRWKDLWLYGSTIQLGNTTLSDTANGISSANAYITSNFKSPGNNILGTTLSHIVSINGSVNTSIIPAANTTYNLGTNTMRWNEIHAQNLHSTMLYIDGDASISGNLYVTGNVTTINVATLSVTDSLIELASNNVVTDLYDIGFYGAYNDGTLKYTGLYRDSSDAGTYKLFFNLTDAPNTTVNTSDASYGIGVLQAYLKSGGLISNATNVAVTANSSLSVSIVANTLTLSTALSGTNGGTGKSSVSNNAVLVGNSSNGYNELTLGTAGYVLQSNGTALVYASIDGGTF